MTFTFTALGILIAYLWVQVAACVILGLGKFVEGKAGWAFFYLGEAIAIAFLLAVR